MGSIRGWPWVHLEQEAINHDEISDSEVTRSDALSCQQHRSTQRCAEDDVLPHVQH